MEVDIAAILNVVLLILSALFGKFFLKVKKTLKEVSELIDKAATVLDDDQVSKEEIESLKKEFKDILAVWQ